MVEGLRWFGLLAIALLLFCLPGWGLLTWLLPGWARGSWLEKLALSTGVSLALYPLLYLYADLLGVRLGYAIPWLLALLGIGLVLGRWYLSRRGRSGSEEEVPGSPGQESLPPQSGRDRLADWVALGLIAVITFTRFWPIRNLDFPMWGDSYQHSMIAQLLADNRGLFRSWQPYAELQTFTYHFGFHALAASLHEVSRVAVPQTVLWLGQYLNVLAVLALYPLANKVGGNRWAGAVGLIVAGLLLKMPMSYVNWGRYTQLAGQVILPVAILIILATLDRRRLAWKPTLLIWLLMAGLALTHYVVVAFAAAFYLAYVLFSLERKSFSITIKQVALQAAGVALLILPWFIRVFQGKLPAILGKQMAASARNLSSGAGAASTLGNLLAFLPVGLWLALVLALGWGLWRRNRLAAQVGAWWLVILLIANLNWLGLPGTNMIDNFTVLIAAYIPAALLIGGAAGWLVQDYAHLLSPKSDAHPEIQKRSSISQPWLGISLGAVILLLAALVGLWGTRQRLKDVRAQQHALMTAADEQAIAWIEANIPDSPRFLVNSFFAFGDTLIVGSDAGWWLPLLAGIQTNVPPLNYGMEQGPFPGYRQWVNELTAQIQEKGLDHRKVLAMLKERGFSHVYIGAQGGRVNNPGFVFDPDLMAASGAYRPVYHQDNVWIFEINYP